MSRTIDTVIFDLDGTLVDSALGILQSFTLTFQTLGLHPVQPLTRSIIGPPLREALRFLAGNVPLDVIDQLVDTFKTHYDTSGFLATQAYPGVALMLNHLSNAGLPLFVATNKRQNPTEKIIEMLHWRHYFQAVYSLDSLRPEPASKAELIRRMVDIFSLRADSTLYVGDRHEDGSAASQAGVLFFHATWGYEVIPESSPLQQAGDIAALSALVGIRKHTLSHSAKDQY